MENFRNMPRDTSQCRVMFGFDDLLAPSPPERKKVLRILNYLTMNIFISIESRRESTDETKGRQGTFNSVCSCAIDLNHSKKFLRGRFEQGRLKRSHHNTNLSEDNS